MKRRLAATIFLLALPLAKAQTQFTHVVMIIQENRTPDNLFGSNPTFEPGVDLATSGLNKQNQVIQLTPLSLGNCFDPGHIYTSFLADYNKGAMNGFDDQNTKCSGPNGSYHYVDNSTGAVQPYFDLATQYGWANYMFQTNEGPSFPAHQFLFSGTSAPSDDSDLFAIDDPAQAGCTAPASSQVKLISPTGTYSYMYPCFTRSTLVDLLTSAGLSWKYYASKGEGYWYAPNSISTLYATTPFNSSPQVLTDIRNCQLANVSWVTPTGPNSDHGGGNNAAGPSWVASIVNAIGSSNCGYWQNTAILITWDDWGGWYDHVLPEQLGQVDGWGTNVVYGFRVPLLVVSAYTSPGYVSNTSHDFGSMLRFTETVFGLGLIGPGTWADSYADNLMEFFPLTAPRAFSMIPSVFDADHFINDTTPPTDPDDD